MKKLQDKKKCRTFALAIQQTAEIAQLVEHNLAKVGVASSSLVFRSRLDSCASDCLFYVRDDRFYFTAEIAQLVEHNLAKVGVASSSLVFRSKSPNKKGQSNEKPL